MSGFTYTKIIHVDSTHLDIYFDQTLDSADNSGVPGNAYIGGTTYLVQTFSITAAILQANAHVVRITVTPAMSTNKTYHFWVDGDGSTFGPVKAGYTYNGFGGIVPGDHTIKTNLEVITATADGTNGVDLEFNGIVTSFGDKNAYTITGKTVNAVSTVNPYTAKLTILETFNDTTTYNGSVHASGEGGVNPSASGMNFAGNSFSWTTPATVFGIISATSTNIFIINVRFDQALTYAGLYSDWTLDGNAGIFSEASVDSVDNTLVHLVSVPVIDFDTHTISFPASSNFPPLSSGRTYLQSSTQFELKNYDSEVLSPPGASFRGNYNRTGKLRAFNDAQKNVRKPIG